MGNLEITILVIFPLYQLIESIPPGTLYNTSFSVKKEFFDLNERHTDMELELPNKNIIFNSYTIIIFLFVSAIISVLVTIIVIYTM